MADASFLNPFCVLGLSADADGQDIRQAAQRALMERKLTGDASACSEEIRMIEGAAERLSDPLERFRAALHWVTLTPDESAAWRSSPDSARFAFDRTLLAKDAYESNATVDSVSIRTHNIAVLHCADAHRLAEAGDLDAASLAWKHGFGLWSLALSSDEFIQGRFNHARRLDDPRLDRAAVRAELSEMPHRLLSYPATLAAQALRKRRTAEAIVIVRLIRDAPFDEQHVDQALQIVYRPLAHRVEQEIDRLEVQREKFVEQYESGDSTDPLAELLVEFKTSVSPDLDQMLELGDLPGLAEEHARDHSAKFLYRLGLAAYNLGENASLAKDATQVAAKYADADSLKKKLDRGLDQLNDQDVLSKQLKEVMALSKSGKISEAIDLLKKLRFRVESTDTKNYLDSLVFQLSEALVSKLFEEATELMARGAQPTTVRRKLEQARRHARDPDTQTALDVCILQTRRIEKRVAINQSTGCLIPIAIGIGLIGAPLLLRGLLA